MVVAFTKYQDAQSRSATRELLDLLGDKKREVDKDLEAEREAMLEFQLKNAKFSFGTGRASPTLERVAMLSAELTKMQLNTLTAQSTYEAWRKVMNDPIKVRQLMETRELKSETAQLERAPRRSEAACGFFRARYGPDYPTLTAIQNSLKQLAEEMEREDRRIIEGYVGQLEQQVFAAKRNEEQISSLLADQSREVFEYNTLAAQYDKLNDELERAKLTANSLNEKLKQFSVAENATGLKVSPADRRSSLAFRSSRIRRWRF